jgi:hypothetical protein
VGFIRSPPLMAPSRARARAQHAGAGWLLGPGSFRADGSLENSAFNSQTVLGTAASPTLRPRGEHPDIAGKRPGYSCPSAGPKFTEVPNDLASIP